MASEWVNQRHHQWLAAVTSLLEALTGELRDEALTKLRVPGTPADFAAVASLIPADDHRILRRYLRPAVGIPAVIQYLAATVKDAPQSEDVRAILEVAGSVPDIWQPFDPVIRAAADNLVSLAESGALLSSMRVVREAWAKSLIGREGPSFTGLVSSFSLFRVYSHGSREGVAEEAALALALIWATNPDAQTPSVPAEAQADYDFFVTSLNQRFSNNADVVDAAIEIIDQLPVSGELIERIRAVSPDAFCRFVGQRLDARRVLRYWTPASLHALYPKLAECRPNCATSLAGELTERGKLGEFLRVGTFDFQTVPLYRALTERSSGGRRLSDFVLEGVSRLNSDQWYSALVNWNQTADTLASAVGTAQPQGRLSNAHRDAVQRLGEELMRGSVDASGFIQNREAMFGLMRKEDKTIVAKSLRNAMIESGTTINENFITCFGQLVKEFGRLAERGDEIVGRLLVSALSAEDSATIKWVTGVVLDDAILARVHKESAMQALELLEEKRAAFKEGEPEALRSLEEALGRRLQSRRFDDASAGV